MRKGGIMTVTKNTFIEFMRIAHAALYDVQRPNDSREYIALKNLIDAYILLLSGLNNNTYDYIRTYLLSHSSFNEADIAMMFDYLTHGRDINH